ncbi:hypothetical protein TNCV_3898721 [Trichonephila clavipes]|nr:hypothetical protein TNCV_3898721 [Trichonephila clavipes]
MQQQLWHVGITIKVNVNKAVIYQNREFVSAALRSYRYKKSGSHIVWSASRAEQSLPLYLASHVSRPQSVSLYVVGLPEIASLQ